MEWCVSLGHWVSNWLPDFVSPANKSLCNALVIVLCTQEHVFTILMYELMGLSCSMSKRVSMLPALRLKIYAQKTKKGKAPW